MRAPQQPDPLPVLYSFRRCPYAMRARLALHVADVAVETREVVLGDKPASLRAISPKATVPVLQLPDGQVLDESLDIMAWALRRNDPLQWRACAEDDAARQWVARNDTEFKPLLDRYKYASRHPALTQQQHRAQALRLFVGPLDMWLRAAPFICGAREGWADAALFPFVRQFAMVEPDWFAHAAPLPALRRWLAFWLASGWYDAIMVRRSRWPDPEPDGPGVV